ncbi:uncharacterized protein V6R79_017033 [Siganus canaliculatus]
MLSRVLLLCAVLAAASCQHNVPSQIERRLYSVGCPGQNIRLECPEGQWMEVLSMQHGVKTSTTTCGITDQPAQVSEEKCLHFLLKPWSRFICNRMSSCRLPKPDAQMFTCGFTEDTFVQVSYRCIIRRPGSQTVVACDGQDVNLKCDDGVISVLKASYGRFDQNTCTSTPSVMTFCASSTAELHVRDLCKGKKECTISTNAQALGKPESCDDLPKYLTVDYVCTKKIRL